MSMNVHSHSVWGHLFLTLWPRLNITEHCHVCKSHDKKWYLIIILICASVMMSMMNHLSIFACRWFCFFPENCNSILIPAKKHLLEKIFSLCFQDTSIFWIFDTCFLSLCWLLFLYLWNIAVLHNASLILLAFHCMHSLPGISSLLPLIML